ncbi:hypothetical protein PFISCL1PPCAC_8010, partial [Pristionchus fissidentatus]
FSMQSLFLLSSLCLLAVGLPWGGDSASHSNEITGNIFTGGNFRHGKGGSSHSGESLNDLAFFFKLSWRAKGEFGRILTNPKLTKGEIETSINEWAAKYNVTEEVDSFFEKKEAARVQFRANITKALEELPAALDKFAAISDDKNTTIIQTLQETRKALNNITTPFLKNLVLEVLSLAAFYD